MSVVAARGYRAAIRCLLLWIVLAIRGHWQLWKYEKTFEADSDSSYIGALHDSKSSLGVAKH